MRVEPSGRRSGARALTVLLASVASSSCWGPTPSLYRRPVAEIYTPDLVSDLERSDPVFWPADGERALAFTLTHLDAGTEGVGREVLSAEEHAALLRAILDGMSLVRVADGSIVPAEAREGLVDVSGAAHPHSRLPGAPFSLVPSVPLEEGWYVLRVDLSAARTFLDIAFSETRASQREGDVLFARVHHGSRPMWARSALACSGTSPGSRCAVHVLLTESLTAPPPGEVLVRYDGVAIFCEPEPPSTYGISVDCPAAPIGTLVEVDFESRLVLDPEGRALVAGDDVTSFVDLRGRDAIGWPAPDLGRALILEGGT